MPNSTRWVQTTVMDGSEKPTKRKSVDGYLGQGKERGEQSLKRNGLIGDDRILGTVDIHYGGNSKTIRQCMKGIRKHGTDGVEHEELSRKKKEL